MYSTHLQQSTYKKSVLSTVIVALLLFACPAFAGTSAIDYGSVGPNSLFSPAADPTNSPISTESVNLYSGQHVESFPLMTLAGRGGLGVRLSLDYNGNVGHIVKAENRTAQVSPFGLGFSLGRQSILVNHGGTAYLYDDTYTLILGSAILGLKYIPNDTTNDTLITQRGDPWRIIRHRQQVGNRDVVTGWTLLRENGTVYQFGDLTTSPDSLNATRNILRYGDYVGNGVTQDDSLYFFRWDIKSIHDPDSLNWVEYTYARDSAYLEVIDPNNSTLTVNSLNPYIRASYISTVTTSAGDKCEFSYTPRLDFHQYLGINNYEFFTNKKVSQIKSVNADDSVLSRIVFDYDYLNAGRDSTLKKLLLKGITPWNSDSTNHLPSTSFEYYTDSSSISFGCMSRVYLPTGAMKEINYGVAPDSANFTDLDLQVEDSAGYPTGLAQFGSFGRNIYIGHIPDDSVRLAVWDGYWHVKTIHFDSTVNQVGVSQQNWAVAHIGTGTVVVFRWQGGAWKTDTLDGTLDIDTNIWRIETGQDCFMIATGHLTTVDSSLVRAKFYVWNGVAWQDKLVVSTGIAEYEKYEVRISNKLYALTAYDKAAPRSWFFIGKFDARQGTIVTQDIGPFENYEIGWRFAVSSDVAAYFGVHGVNLYRWKDTLWAPKVVFTVGTSRDIHAISALPNGIAYSYGDNDDNEQIEGANAQISTYFFGVGPPNTVDQAFLPANIAYEIAPLYGGSSSYSIGTRYSHLEGGKPRWIRGWNGTYWQWTQNAGNSTRGIALFPNSYYVGGEVVSRFTGNNFASQDDMWTNNQSLQLSDSGHTTDISMAFTEDYVIGYRRHHEPNCRPIYDTTLLYLWSPYTGNLYSGHSIRSWNGDYCYGKLKVNRRKFSGSNSGFSEARRWSFNNYGWIDVYLNRLIDTLFSGKAPLVAVSSVKLYNGAQDPNPIVVDYTYQGGILDQQGNTPRFARVTVSTPHFSDTVAEGYSIHCFYNDINKSDSAQFGGLSYPDLQDSVRYGIPNGGYRLDGLQYCQYSYNAVQPDSIIDSVLTFHSLVATPENAFEVYRIQADSTIAYSEGFTDTTYQYYDPNSGLPTSSKRRADDGNDFVIDSTVYATYGADSISVSASHELTLPYEKLSVLDSAGNRSVLSRTRTYYQQKGYHRPTTTYSWIDASSIDTTDAVRTFATFGDSTVCYDSVGNLRNSQDALGVVSSIKYDLAGVLPVASATNVPSYGFLSQDFEQGSAWDGWNCKEGNTNIQFDTVAFTGQKSILITDLAGTDRNWGPSRTILADSLTDSLYAFSAWVNTKHTIRVYCWGQDIDTATLTGGYKYKEYADLSLPDNEWILISDTFDLRAVQSDPGFYQITLQLVLEDGTAGVDSANFDDFRFCPISAAVSTTVYDPVSLLPVAKAGVNNYPGRTAYDEFYRPIVTYDKDWNALQKTEMKLPPETTSALSTIQASMNEPTFGVDSTVGFAAGDGMLKYTLAMTTLAKVHGDASIYKNGQLMDKLECVLFPCDGIVKNDSFSVVAGDAILVLAEADSLDSLYDYTASATFMGHSQVTYDSAAPNFTKVTTYRPGIDSLISYSYYDALGRALQTRSQAVVNDTVVTIVSNAAVYNARGKAIKTFMSYRDVSGATGLTDYTLPDSVLAEANAFYNGVYAPDCNGYPYSESKYAAELKSRLLKTSGPTSLYNMASGKTTTYSQGFDFTKGEIVSSSVDPDSIQTRSLSERRGLYKRAISYFSNGSDSTVTISSRTLRGDSSFTVIDTGATSFTLKTSTVDNLGREVSTWQKGYGKIDMVYDDAGNLRFMRNDKRAAENKFVYFKYDAQGRKIEEGLFYDAIPDSFFTRDNANSRNFPGDGLSGKTATYRWVYDQLPGQAPVNSLGKLVRVENADSSYYKEFTYYPGGDSDFVVVKLPIADGSLKGIKHIYNKDGSLKRLVIQPDIADSTSYRAIAYGYNSDGSLDSLVQAPALLNQVIQSPATYAKYTYNADGSVRRMLLGAVSDTSALQKVDYTYDALGRLTAINKPSNSFDLLVGTVSGMYSGGFDNDHYDLNLQFYDGTLGTYANGRPKSLRVRTSSPTNAILGHKYELTYDDRGWLTSADDTAGSANDRLYTYDALGLRTSLSAGGIVTNYAYDSDWRYLGPAGVADSLQRKYDALGNMIADSSLGVLEQRYDYRNQLDYARTTTTASGAPPDTLTFVYDQTQKRISKRYWYEYWSTCPDGGAINPIGLAPEPKLQFGVASSDDPPTQFTLTGTGGNTVPCLKIAVAETHYLYDGGILIATFDESDRVRDFFINGPNGRIADYQFNDDSSLVYYLNDHLGSPRAIVQPGASPQMVSYTHYYPFGATLESWTSGVYNQFLYTGKERDEHGAFDYYYFGARYYDATTGTFTSFDKAGQFPGGFRYGNDPMLGVDGDGNFFFVPLLIAAAYGAATSAAVYTGFQAYSEFAYGQSNFSLSGLLSAGLTGAVTGGLSNAASPVINGIGSFSAVGKTAASSVVNSVGSALVNGGPVTVGFGFGSLDLSNGRFSTTSLKGNGALSAVSGAARWATGVGAAMKDAIRLQSVVRKLTGLNGIPEKEENVVGKWEYHNTGSKRPAADVKNTFLPENTSIIGVRSGGDNAVHTFIGPIPENGVIIHRRGVDFKHWVGLVERDSEGNIAKLISGETHINYWPSQALGSLGSIPHFLLESGRVPFMSTLYNNRLYLEQYKF